MQIARIFEETAANEKEHAELWFKQLHGGSIPSTVDNLADAAAGEHYEWTQMYADFAKVAREEGFTAIATAFELVAKIELPRAALPQASREYRNRQGLQTGRRHRLDLPELRPLYTGETPPALCPVCKHPQSYFQLHIEDY